MKGYNKYIELSFLFFNEILMNFEIFSLFAESMELHLNINLHIHSYFLFVDMINT